ncbi:hypothetical protein CEXT_190291 [Caerostris extrusa]|uniref:Ycf15 n=1 Tax=Caerostris extrusa TaxID=172846 RepID=A0AAV4RD50_CAEEX|nr:hypothetical protein CEXT_190291 [Caerostris extrusa]
MPNRELSPRNDSGKEKNRHLGKNIFNFSRGRMNAAITVRPASFEGEELVCRETPSSLSKRATDWDSDSGHMSDVLPRGSQTLKRPQPRRHHTVGFETGSMTSLPRPSLDLEVSSTVLLVCLIHYKRLTIKYRKDISDLIFTMSYTF